MILVVDVRVTNVTISGVSTVVVVAMGHIMRLIGRGGGGSLGS